MRQLLFVFALMSALSLARAAETLPLKTNSVVVEKHGTLEVLTPRDWTLIHTNVHLPGNPPSVEFHAPSNIIALRLTIYWDGFYGTNNPTETGLSEIVSNTVIRTYQNIATEKTLTLEKLKGPDVIGSFARVTDSGWTPMVKDEYPNLATGMFRSGNLWGTFDLLCFDKDGPQFHQGLKIIESLHRIP